MDVQIQAIGFSAGQELKQFVHKKLEKLETFHDKIISADVFMKLDNHQQIKDKVAEIKLHIPGSTLFAKETAKSFEESVDLAVDSLRRQVKKHKEKMYI